MHLREELLAMLVDETHVGEIDDSRNGKFPGLGALPAFLQFADGVTGEPPFDKQADVARDFLSGNS